MRDNTLFELLQEFESSGGQHISAFMLTYKAGVDLLKGCMYVFEERLEPRYVSIWHLNLVMHKRNSIYVVT